MAGNSPVKWIFELFDRVSSPARSVVKSFTDIMDASGRTRDELGRFSKAQSDVARGFKEGLGHQWSMEVHGLGKAALSMTANLSTAMVSLAAFKESTMQSLNLMLGGEGPAQEFFDSAIEFARKTPFSPSQVINSMKDLVGGGFSADEAKILFQASGDVAALGGGGEQAMGSIALVLSQIKGRGTLTTGDLNQMVNTTSRAGIGRAELFKTLAGHLGVESTAIPGMMEKGLIPADMAVYSFVESVKNRFGELGAGMEMQSKTLSGQWSTMTGLAEEFVLGINFEDVPGIQMLKDSMAKVTEYFDAASPRGQKLQGIVVGAFNAIGGVVSNVTDAVLYLFESLDGSGFSEAFGDVDWMDYVRTGIWGIASVIKSLIDFIGLVVKGWRELIDFMNQLDTFFEDVGKGLTDGFKNGLLAGFGNIIDLIKNFGLDTIQTLKGILGIHSPSAEFADIGRNSALGYQQGLEGEFDDIGSSLGTLGGLSSNATGARGGLGGPISVTVQLSVDARGQDGEQIARQLEDLLPSSLASVFERLSMEAGVA